MARNPFIPKPARKVRTIDLGGKSKGILDDHKTGKVDITREVHCTSFQMKTADAAPGRVLFCDGDGNAYWDDLP